MASSSGGTSSGSMSMLQNLGSEEDLQQLMEQRKRKRMISNRESARRSRMRKQKHLDDLMAQVAQLGKENSEIITTINLTSQHYLNVEAENSILRAQVAELSHRLQSLNEIISLIHESNYNGGCLSTEEPYGVADDHHHQSADGFMNSLWNYPYFNQPIMASCADMLQY